MLDDIDLLILQTIHNYPSVSYMEIRDAIRTRSVATVHNRLYALAEQGFITLPAKRKQPRSLKLTPSGCQVLTDRMLI